MAAINARNCTYSSQHFASLLVRGTHAHPTNDGHAAAAVLAFMSWFAELNRFVSRLLHGHGKYDGYARYEACILVQLEHLVHMRFRFSQRLVHRIVVQTCAGACRLNEFHVN